MSTRLAARSLGRLHRSSTVFFVCDIQEKFRSGIHAFPCMVSVAQKMIKAAHILDVPYIVTEQYSKGLGFTVPELDTSKAVGVYDKTKFSMIIPEVTAKLQELKSKSVVIFGIETVLDLLEQEYDVHVLADGVSSMSVPEIQVALNRMAQAGAIITSSESVIFQLAQDSNDPKFKQISALVKEYQQSARENALMFKEKVAL
ncbi:hypothetical protein EV182_001126 [Spiromyces aspiralis]|uniref:Uncharacterized protein n=1 Tax=Spiromyces aspiralis TaxID=68401 RepID=A0ACC1I176_9FUNG|nr:hypothetical protein EV182_001126 [Spiromyces aspiralis]